MKLLHHLRLAPQGELMRSTSRGSRLIRYKKFRSHWLRRKIVVDLFLPPHYLSSDRRYKVLILNDGQDMEALHLMESLDQLYEHGMDPIIAVGIHAGNRLSEYGTAERLDYLKRGAMAGAYTRFVIEELLPFLRKSYRVETGPAAYSIAGCSLGGLSALDISWHHPQIFGKVGVLSGSFWWRSRAYEAGYQDDQHRIMHQIIRQGPKREGMKFWFQTGTNDEKCDRNNSGIIDSIEDTLDLIEELEKVGYRRNQDIKYVEIEGGEHNFGTWSQVLPQFLKWAFPSLKEPVN